MKDGEKGWKWGENGACYTGPDAKKKAIKQGYVIEGPDKFKNEMSKLSFFDRVEVYRTINEKES